MSFQKIRARIESQMADGLSVPVIYDNVQETPPDLPYAVCLISYSDTTLPVICADGEAVENIRGNIQLSIYSFRGRGMAELELYAAEGMTVMNTMYDKTADAQVKCGQISGPDSVLSGDNPYALVTLSCPFTAAARMPNPKGGKLKTNQVALTNPLP